MDANIETHKLNDIKKLGLDLIETTWIVDTKSFNLIKLGWKFNFNKKKSCLGVCSLKEKTIFISEFLAEANSELIDVWIDTIKHEIAHAIDFEIRGKSDHSYKWKSIAKQVGCIPKGKSTVFLKEPNGKYTLSCETCSYQTFRHRVLKRKRACRKCCTKHNGGKYSSQYDLVVTQNY